MAESKPLLDTEFQVADAVVGVIDAKGETLPQLEHLPLGSYASGQGKGSGGEGMAAAVAVEPADEGGGIGIEKQQAQGVALAADGAQAVLDGVLGIRQPDIEADGQLADLAGSRLGHQLEQERGRNIVHASETHITEQF